MSDNRGKIEDELYVAGNACRQRGMDFTAIQQHLLTLCNDEELVLAVMKKIKSAHYAESTKQGVKFIITGLVLLLAGFVIACVNYHSSQSINFAMYGLTSAGLIILFYGMFKVIG